MSSLSPQRCIGINQAVLADDGGAVLFELIMEGGQIFPLELDGVSLELLTRVVLAGAHAMGTEQPDRSPLSETVPSESVQMSAHEVVVRAHADGPVLLMRVGAIDVTLSLPNQVLANALASAVAGGGKP